MAVQYTPFPIKTSTGTAQAVIQIDPDNPSSTPKILAKDKTTLLANWDSVSNKWAPADSGPVDQTGTPPPLPSGLGFSSSDTYSSILTQNERIFTQNTTAVINKLPEEKKNAFKSANTYQPYTTFAERQEQTENPANNNASIIDSLGERVKDYENENKISEFLKNNYRYPTNIDGSGQDYIIFKLFEYGTRDISRTTGTTNDVTDLFELTQRTKSKEPLGTVILPIQQGISDQNMISWADENLSPLGIAAMKSAQNPEEIGGNFANIINLITNNDQYKKLLQQQIYGAAAGINPLARYSGLIINPNLELLFSGPTLRPFNFNFRLSPRSGEEATQVKNIIRWFKQGSVVRTTTDNLFLKAPNVFEIQYVFGKNKGGDHPGLNRIKTCALRNITVNYNPDGSYMTFEDGTMTSYEMILQFSELEPVYDVDYDSTSENSIGY